MKHLRYTVLLLVLLRCTTTPEEIPTPKEEIVEQSILNLELNEQDRIKIYSLPSRYWPEVVPGRRLLSGRSEKPLFSGLDVISLDSFRLLKNRKFALLTNATGLDRNLNASLELLLRAGLKPSLIFEPEHGLFGAEDSPSVNGIRYDPAYDVRILSLYSDQKKPRPDQLEGIDSIVVDIFNLPVRCYTYVSTLTYIMEAAADNRIEVIVLDRPNPYGFWKAAGAQLERGYESFVSTAPVPFLYSMTPGEYVRYMASIRYTNLSVSIVKVANYSRDEMDAPLRQSWINPSPNIPSLEAAYVYPGMVFFEGTNISLGRGTTRPFIYSGSPWMNSREVLRRMRQLDLPGVQLAEIIYSPNTSLYRGEKCHGIQVIPVSAEFDPIRTGYEYMRIVREIHPQFTITGSEGNFFIDRLWGGPGYRLAINSDMPYSEFKKTWETESSSFESFSAEFRLY